MHNWQRKSLVMLMANTAVWMTIPAAAQTQVDLRTQSKSVDFTAAPSTRPVKTGTVLPAVCTVGDLFFKTNAAAGSNLYGCIATNTWVLQSGGGGGGGGSLTVQVDGVNVGSRPIENFVSGAGIVNTIQDTGTQINIQHAVDTATILTKAAAQSGSVLLCASASGSATAYSCTLSSTISTYTTGMVLEWKPDANAAGSGVTLNVDTLGAKAVKLADGTTDPTVVDILAGRLYPIWYDGSVFRLLMPPPVTAVASVSQPTCSVILRGRLWFTASASGTKDGLTVCAKDAADAYAWRVLY